MAYQTYEWLFEDTRLIIYDGLMTVSMIHPEAKTHLELFGLRNCEDQFIAQMKEDNVTAVFVTDIPRTVNGKYQRGYWVLSFNSTQHSTLFKLKYAHAL